eukprot:g36705.t1
MAPNSNPFVWEDSSFWAVELDLTVSTCDSPRSLSIISLEPDPTRFPFVFSAQNLLTSPLPPDHTAWMESSKLLVHHGSPCPRLTLSVTLSEPRSWVTSKGNTPSFLFGTPCS